jgi:hypothetical protein
VIGIAQESPPWSPLYYKGPRIEEDAMDEIRLTELVPAGG